MKEKSRTLGIMKTHILNDEILEEYLKFNRSNLLSDTILFIDNHKKIVQYDTERRLTELKFKNCSIKAFLADELNISELELPMLSENQYSNDLSKVFWYNSDYPMYIVSKYFPNYEYYLFTEYDVFCNGETYDIFLNKYKNNSADLIITDFRSVDKYNENWYWKYQTEWIYPKTEKFGCFFPVGRFSKKAIDFLYKKRLKYGEIYKKYVNSGIYKWIFCECFAATELANNGFACEKLDGEFIRWNYKFDKNEIIKHPDNELYHPIK